MRLKLCRVAMRDNYCIGRLTIDGEPFCDTLELPWKNNTPNKSCIPEGIYTVILSQSPAFGRILPLLLNVPKRSAIRIHAGNTAKDSCGCILVGENRTKGRVCDSRVWEKRLMEKMTIAAGQKDLITIQIINGSE